MAGEDSGNAARVVTGAGSRVELILIRGAWSALGTGEAERVVTVRDGGLVVARIGLGDLVMNATRNERDYAALQAAVKDGKAQATTEI